MRFASLKFLETYSRGSVGVVAVLVRRGWPTDRKNRRHASRDRTRRGGAESDGAQGCRTCSDRDRTNPSNGNGRASTRCNPFFLHTAIPRAHRACSARPAKRSGVQRNKRPLAHPFGRIPATRRLTRALHAAHSARVAAVLLSFDIICIVT
ncbi:hypothetical protein T492DRAFT_1008852 [Pavlovales sp. CCMP2436]|nr:hypothetical protein T492DRAFT_1008852 [Pavlovales sp. CCMP2436]